MSVRVKGRGLHTGAACTVTLERCHGPITIVTNACETAFIGARVIDATRSTSIAVGTESVSTVEHLAAALFGCGVRDSVRIIVEGAELPLLDGASLAWARAIENLGVFGSRSGLSAPREMRIIRDGVITVGASRYFFAPARGPQISASFLIGEPRFDARASWDGSRDSFVRDIASARTFSREADVAELALLGKASHVAPESVVVLCTDRVLFAGAPFADDEPARHKLLDLIGDTFVRCGALQGAVHAEKPGHAATHEAFNLAIAEGVIA